MLAEKVIGYPDRGQVWVWCCTVATEAECECQCHVTATAYHPVHLRNATPPAYTEWIGSQLMASLLVHHSKDSES